MNNIIHKLLKSIHPSINTKRVKKKSSDYDRLYKIGLSKNTIKLHIGCGPRVLKGWVNIDLAYEPYKNYLKYYTDKYYGKKVRGRRSDFFAINVVKYPLPLKSRSVSVVFHEDFIEHLDQKEQFLFLSEMYRVLKKGGVHRVNTPDINSTMLINSKFNEGFNGVYQLEWDKHVHKNILSANTLKEMAQLIGYSNVIIQKRDKSLGRIPKEYRPDPNDRPESGNIYVDLIK